jgi:hypothetical protein
MIYVISSRPVSSIGKRKAVKSGDPVNYRTVQVSFVLIDHEFLSTVIQFLAKVKATSTDKLLDSLSGNDVVAELCSGKFNVTYCHDTE